MTDLFFIDGESRKYWGAAVDGRVLHTAWGRLEGYLQTKTATFPTPDAALAECSAQVRSKRLKGYREGRPLTGSRAFVAHRHAHADIVYLDAYGSISCATCHRDVKQVRVGPAPPRPAPRDEKTVKPKKRESTKELTRELNALEKRGWNEVLGARERAKIDRRTEALAQKIGEIELRNEGVTTPRVVLGAVPGVEVQADLLWSLASSFDDGDEIEAVALVRRARARLAKSDLGRRVAKALDAEGRAIWGATVAGGKATDRDRIGGSPAWLGAAQWPSCRACKEPMKFVGQVSAGPRTPIPLLKGRRIYMFHCADHCFDARPHGVVIQPNGSKVTTAVAVGRALPPLRMTFKKGFERPRPEDLEADSAAAIACSLLDAGDDYATKIGGHPHWIQSGRSPRCPVCRKPFAFVGRFDALMHSSTRRNDLWGDAGCFYLLLCHEHEQGHLELEHS